VELAGDGTHEWRYPCGSRQTPSYDCASGLLGVFCASVLLGIRYKSEWIDPRRPELTVVIFVEWLVGIALYVTFIALVRSTGFAYVKGLLGF
jgi:hypothetical protein